MDTEKKILKAMEKFETANSDTVAAISGVPRKEVNKMLPRMEKYGMVEPVTKKEITYWKRSKPKPKRMFL